MLQGRRVSRKTSGYHAGGGSRRQRRPLAEPPRAPSAPSPSIVRAATLFQQGRLKEADDLLQRLLATAPTDHSALHLLGVIATRRRDYARAVKLLDQAIGIEARITAYHGNLGHAYLMAEQFAAAAACYRRVLTLEPAAPLARFGLGMAHLGQRDFAAAAAMLAQVVAAVPDHIDARANFGTALSELGRHEEAVAHLSLALARKPDSAALHFKYGMACKGRGDLLAACRHLARAAVLDPQAPDPPFQVGLVLLALDRLDEGERALREAVTLAPDMVPALYELGQASNRLQSFDDAARCFERVQALDPESPAPYLGLARTRHLQGRCDEARALVEQALAHHGDEAECRTMLGLIHQSEGHFDQAAAAYREAIAARPTHAHAHLCLAMIRKAAAPVEQIQELERVRALDALEGEQRTTLEYALAREYERLGDHDAAFDRYKAANDRRRVQYPFDVSELATRGDRLTAVFNEALFGRKAGFGSGSDRPVFVVGMMRSGTTLTEQILASHPQVHGHGELDHIRRIVMALPEKIAGAQPYPECVAALDRATALRIAEDHVAWLAREAPTAARSIDKLPHNFERLGVIGLLFPQARIIHCTRDPIDTCLSSYFHDFGSDNRFTYDLDGLGRFYRYYQRLMAHWKAVLPNPILDVPYEDLVSGQEGWSRQLVDFLDLPWDERCLTFYDSERPVYTYSLWQVRQPVYQSSVGRWHPYARHLAPLFDALGLPRPEV
jgi:tetratricopeptide (TPR) repeat protein